MKTRTVGFTLLVSALFVLLLTPVQAAASQSVSSHPALAPTHAGITAELASTPVMFVENVGQFGDGARFQVRGSNATIYLTDDALWFTILEKPQAGAREQGDSEKFSVLPRLFLSAAPELPIPAPLKGVNLKVSFVGANAHPSIKPFQRLDTHVSYFTGSNPAKWHADVPVYGGVRYKNLYPGIDLEIGSEGGQMLPRIVAQPSANLNAVQLRVDGADKLTLAGEQVQVTTAVGAYTLPLFQVAGAANAQLPHPTAVGVQVRAPFARSAIYPSPFTISNSSDLLYSTYLGGSNRDYGDGIAVDGSGATYVTGYTLSTDLPTTPGAFQTTFGGGSADAFVTKLNHKGTALLFSTYLGGNSGIEAGNEIAIDGDGAVYVTGTTESSNFPTTPGAFQTTYSGSGDAFVTRLDSTGTALLYSTYLSGSSRDYGCGIAVDGSGAAYVTGTTESSNFPTTGAFQTKKGGGSADAFVTKLNPAGTALLYSTYLGGRGDDYGDRIAVDGSGATYVTGVTYSSNFPTTTGTIQATFGGGQSDAFVTKLSPTGKVLLYSTYLGGKNMDYGNGIAVDGSGAAYVTGTTYSTNFPTTPGAVQTTGGGYYDAFVTKLSPTGKVLLYSTYLGGSNGDSSSSIAVDSSGAAYVTGYAGSTNFPTTPGAFQTTGSGYYDAFVTMLNSTGTVLLYSTYLGGSHNEEGAGIAVDGSGAAYVTGYTSSTNFPTTPGVLQSAQASQSYEDGFVTKLRMPITQFVEDSSPFVSYNAWYGIADPNASSSGYRVSKAANSTASFSFKGTSVTWLTLKGPDQGKAQVLIDGMVKETFDDYLPTATYTVTNRITGLSNQTHTITVKVLGTKNASATAAYVVIDGFVVGTKTIEETAPAIQYNTWTGNAGTNASGRAFRMSAAAGAFVQFTFSGTSIDWITAKGPGYGQAKVLIDGKQLGKVIDLYSASQRWQVPISFTGLTDGQHVIKIQVLGTRNAKATGTNIVVDGFTGPIMAGNASLSDKENDGDETASAQP